MRIGAPCISVCQFDGRTGWCAGCGRTIPEIRAWRKMTPYRRTSLARELPRRLAQMGKAQPRRPISAPDSASVIVPLERGQP